MAYERRSFSGATPTDTTISGSLAAGATSFTLSSATGWPTTTAGGFVATIDAGLSTEEQVLVGTRSGTACSNVTRGYGGTTDQEHSSGASVKHTSAVTDYNEANYTAAETVGKATTKGDLLVADGANSFSRVGVGANATIPIADSSETTGVKWVAVSGDATIATTGAVTIANDAITAAKVGDAELKAIAGLTSAADKVPYFTGSGTADVATFTSAGRALVDDADASAQRTTLGLGSIATQASSSVTITGGSISGITDLAVADGGTGASTKANARTNLGINVVADQPARVALSPAAGDLCVEQDFGHILVYTGSAWVYLDTPPGSVLWDAGTTAPNGYLYAFGQTLTGGETTHPGLWARLPSAFKSGSNIVLPDLRGRTAAGLDNMGGSDAGRLDWANTIGTVGGTQTHTLTGAESGTSVHGHSVSDPGHTHTTGDAAFGTGLVDYGAGGRSVAAATGSNTTGLTVVNSSAANASSAHNNMQPTILLNGMIRL